MKRFKDKVALVTGAAQGIGLACAERLAQEGALVVGADLQDSVFDAMKAIGGIGIKADMSSQDDITRLFDSALKQVGKLDVLVNNAAVTCPADFLDYKLEDFERVLRINLTSAFSASQRFSRELVARNAPGAIVNMSSINGQVALPNQTAYVTSKGGLNQLTKVIAISLAKYGIRANAIGPGTILTEMSKARVLATEESRHRILSRTPLGRPGDVSEIASVAAFLASDDASYMTGQIVYVEGGRLALNYTCDVPAAA
ncbi:MULTISPECIES: SDR family NAD(P)-dependent oxidoreductase [Burkholderia]|uniref:3-alpha-hydroxysteroid dehydrogenase n=1 Tax=Burkholderia anthina TaxID=179879 RepID=A0A6P2G4M8_9BURK|nr:MULTISPECIES: SDR family NAD(P)-dependent oxidoreductase [Burkholderia]AXK65146.1 SDR family oxidoreductase [Burkholderia sp. IDO3]MBM2766695.1 SDR family oxidoreductase [Burkholderia anthina]PCD61756.1 dehydrogenase [Burkholderia sp. IDO3]VVU48527.1 3-alpha-hydroxysteroid dehydrogenase [Burkholderia anthina]